MNHADARYVGARRPLDIVGRDDLERIHEAALEVLAETGCMLHSEMALDVLEEHGATVDRETTAARIPRDAVEQALSTCRDRSRWEAASRRSTSSETRAHSRAPTGAEACCPPSAAAWRASAMTIMSFATAGSTSCESSLRLMFSWRGENMSTAVSLPKAGVNAEASACCVMVVLATARLIELSVRGGATGTATAGAAAGAVDAGELNAGSAGFAASFDFFQNMNSNS